MSKERLKKRIARISAEREAEESRRGPLMTRAGVAECLAGVVSDTSVQAVLAKIDEGNGDGITMEAALECCTPEEVRKIAGFDDV